MDNIPASYLKSEQKPSLTNKRGPMYNKKKKKNLLKKTSIYKKKQISHCEFKNSNFDVRMRQ